MGEIGGGSDNCFGMGDRGCCADQDVGYIGFIEYDGEYCGWVRVGGGYFAGPDGG